jgi:hypothetical protein
LLGTTQVRTPPVESVVPGIGATASRLSVVLANWYVSVSPSASLAAMRSVSVRPGNVSTFEAAFEVAAVRPAGSHGDLGPVPAIRVQDVFADPAAGREERRAGTAGVDVGDLARRGRHVPSRNAVNVSLMASTAITRM